MAEETSDRERERVRRASDRDRAPEREGGTSNHNRGYDESVEGVEERSDVDPDSAEAEVDRDDMLDDR